MRFNDSTELVNDKVSNNNTANLKGKLQALEEMILPMVRMQPK
jgi:hypothetical protein